MEELKYRIKQLRTMLNLSMADFAAKINVSPGNVGDWESKKRSSVPSAAALKVISETFNVSLDWLILGYDRENSKYSHTVLSKYTANSRIYEELVDISLKLTEEQLADLLSYAQFISKSKKRDNTKVSNGN